MRISVVLIGLAAIVAGPALAVNDRDWNDCQADDPDRSIAGCTPIIQDRGGTTKIRVIAYNNRGIAYSRNGDLDRAIADYNDAIRLDPKDALAHNNRGGAYSLKGDLDRAIADYNEAIHLDPKYANAYNNRGNAWKNNGDFDRAIADYNDAIRLQPKNPDYFYSRGVAYRYSGTLAKALADVSQASELDPKDAYNALWLDIVGQLNNVPSRLSQAAKQLDMTAWPAPVVRLFLDQMTPAAVLAVADDPNPAKKKAQVCEANFYSGILAVWRDAKDEAAILFRLAARDCPKSDVEWFAANAELRALGAAP